MASTKLKKQFAQFAIIRSLANGSTASKVQKGFTLIELLVVIVILGILAAIALPALLSQQKKAVASANNSAASSVARACAAAIAGSSAADFDTASVGKVTGSCSDTLPVSFTSDTDSTKATAAVAEVTAKGGVVLSTASTAK